MGEDRRAINRKEKSEHRKIGGKNKIEKIDEG